MLTRQIIKFISTELALCIQLAAWRKVFGKTLLLSIKVSGNVTTKMTDSELWPKFMAQRISSVKAKVESDSEGEEERIRRQITAEKRRELWEIVVLYERSSPPTRHVVLYVWPFYFCSRPL